MIEAIRGAVRRRSAGSRISSASIALSTPRGTGADGARRGAAPRARRRDPGPADRGQARRRRLGRARGRRRDLVRRAPRPGRSACRAASSSRARRRTACSPAWSSGSASRRCAPRPARRCACSAIISCSARRSSEALRRAPCARRRAAIRHSYDMLGEGARTARRRRALFRVLCRTRSRRSARRAGDRPLPDRPGISVKLSALHPRYEAVKRERVHEGAGAAAPRPRPRGEGARSQLHRRRRGGRSARTVAGRHRRGRSPIRRSPAGTASASPSRPIRSAPPR